MPRKVLAIRHVPFEHLGLISDSLAAHGIAWKYADLYAGGEADVRQADGLILMGGPMSANDDVPYIRRGLELIGEAARLGLPILGVCLGSQLIAKALGSRVYKNPVKEIGWFPIHWTEATARDPLHRGLSGSDTVFHWHGETFDLPAGAELLASSDACRNQAYRVGSNIYGLQYHLEVTPAMITDWIEQDANCGDLREIQKPMNARTNAPRLAELASQVFGRWCGLAQETQPC
jgi:GMP synthase-like glutamine amidotransferase